MNKTLVCVLSETRAHELTWKSFKKNVLDELSADLLLCISVPEDYDFINPYWQFARYKCSSMEFDDWGDAFDKIQNSMRDITQNSKAPNWRKLLNLSGNWLGGIKHEQQSGSGAILIYMRWLLLTFLIREGLLDKYDRFIITRSDFIWKSPHPPVNNLSPENIWIPDGESYGGLCDRHTVLSKENILESLNLVEPLLMETELSYTQMQNIKEVNWNLEQFIDYSFTRKGLKDRVKFFPYIMYSVREWNGSTSWSKGQWSDDLGYYIKYRPEFQSATSASLIIKTLDDWNNFFACNACIGFNSRVMDQQGNIFLLQGNKLVSTNISFINKESLLLSIDYSDRSGFLYLSKYSFGSCEKYFQDEVELIPKNSSTFNLISRKDRGFYAVNAEGFLIKSITNKYDFLFQNKYIYSK